MQNGFNVMGIISLPEKETIGQFQEIEVLTEDNQSIPFLIPTLVLSDLKEKTTKAIVNVEGKIVVWNGRIYLLTTRLSVMKTENEEFKK